MLTAKHQIRFLIVLFSSTFISVVSLPLLADKLSSDSIRNNCQILPEIVKNMPIGKATFISASNGNKHNFQYRLADTPERMQHGFQHTCGQTIATMQMLFKFAFPYKPSFHMNNVVAPLDIAFIDANGKITDIFLMKTYTIVDLKKNLYSPSQTVLYALEAHAGYFAKLGVKVGDYVDIKQLK